MGRITRLAMKNGLRGDMLEFSPTFVYIYLGDDCRCVMKHVLLIDVSIGLSSFPLPACQ